MDKIIHSTVTLSCNIRKAFEMFTVSEQLQKWLAPKAEISPVEGGIFELFWNPADPNVDSTKDCRILAIQEPDFLNFEWKGAQIHAETMNNRPLTNVTVIFTPKGDEATIVTVLHTGWGDSPAWDEARNWFVKAWDSTLSKLQSLYNDKPGA